MKKSLLAFFVFTSAAVFAQTDMHCASEQAMKKLYDAQPELKAKRMQQDKAYVLRAQNKTTTVSATYIIPVVVHVLHQGGPENISDAQVRDAIRVTNLDYAKQNTDFSEVLPEFQTIADSTKIQFVLATRDPNGDCTTGIIHHYDTDTDWDDQSPTLFSHSWNSTMYMNIYVVRSITMGNGFQAAGYAYYPGSWPDGHPFDAMVLLHNYFGTIGTGHPFLTRVLTHEAGHWLNLAHVFGSYQTAGIDCSDDDYVNDTPTTIGYGVCPNAAIPATYQICTPGVSENYQNFMDYSYCTRMFTQGQAQRMQFCLQGTDGARNNLWTDANLIATGVKLPSGPCEPIADFSISRRRVCVNTPVVFTDNTYGGAPTVYNWFFSGGQPATSTFSNASVTYAAPGLYNVSYTVTNAAGTSSITKNSVIEVVPNTSVYYGNWTEGFETLQNFNNWTTESLNGSSDWERTAAGAATGIYSVKINRLMNTRKNRSSLTSPLIDVSPISNPVFTFKLALAESYPNHQNVLKVHVSSDCSQTWTTIYSKNTPNLITSASTNSNFIPVGSSNWRTESINLNQFNLTGLLTFKFEYLRDTLPQTNNIYLDDINITGIVGMGSEMNDVQNLNVFPIPARDALTASFALGSPERITFSISDVLGRTVELQAEKQFSAGKQEQQLVLPDGCAPGVYFLQMQMGTKRVTQKIVVNE